MSRHDKASGGESVRHRRRDVLKMGVIGALSAGTFADGALANQGIGNPANGTGPSFYVSPDGNDDWNGRVPDRRGNGNAGPFRTLERARDAVKAEYADDWPDTGVTVYLRGGEYQRESAFELTAENSGEEGAPLRFEAYQDEEPAITGGVTIDPSGWEPVSGDVRGRLPESARDHVMQIDLAAQGITDLGQLHMRGGLIEVDADLASELFFEGSPQELARWPNDGYVQTGEVLNDGGWYNSHSDDPEDRPVWEYLDDRIEGWQDISDVWLFGYVGKQYSDQRLRIHHIDEEANTLTTAQPNQYPVEKGHDYYYLNVLEELDRPGEYYVDRDAGMLYFYPPEDTPVTEGLAEISFYTGTFVEMTDASNVEFHGLNFQTSRGHGLEMHGGKHNRLVSCVFDGMAGRALQIDNGGSVMSEDNGLVGCNVQNIGSGGMILGGGNRDTLTPANNFVLNCKFENYNRIVRTGRIAVRLNGIGNRIAHNEFSDSQTGSIHFNGNEHLIERNHFHHVVQKASDAGAIYTGRNPTERGNVVRYNLISDVNSSGDVQECGVYIDDRNADVTIHGNVFFNVNLGIQLGGGRYNTVTNNLLLFCDRSLELDARGLLRHDRTATGCFENGDYYEHLDDVPYTEEPWASRYPGLLTHQNDDPCVPKYNVIKRNVIYRTRDMYITDLEEFGFDFEAADVENNVQTDQNLGFVDTDDFSLEFAADSLVKSEIPDWQRLNVSSIGLEEDDSLELRTDVPDLREAVNQFGSLVIELDDPSDNIIDPGETAPFSLEPLAYDGEAYQVDSSEIETSVDDPEVIDVDFANETITGVENGDAIVDATATVGDRTGTDDLMITVFPLEESDVPEPWQVTNWGEDTKGYAEQNDDGSFRLASNGFDIWSGPDTGTFLHQTQTADVTNVTATVTAVNDTDTGSMGVMIRADADNDDAAYVNLRISRDGGCLLTWQPGEAKGSQYASVGAPAGLPQAARVLRYGTQFKPQYQDADGNWQTVQELDIDMGDTVDAGFAMYAHNDEYGGSGGEFLVYDFEGSANTDVPVRAPVNVNAAFTDSGSVDLSWDAAANAEGYHVYRADDPTQTLTKQTSSPVTSTSYTDDSPTPGITVYAVTALDDEGEETALSDPASAGDPSVSVNVVQETVEMKGHFGAVKDVVTVTFEHAGGDALPVGDLSVEMANGEPAWGLRDVSGDGQLDAMETLFRSTDEFGGYSFEGRNDNAFQSGESVRAAFHHDAESVRREADSGWLECCPVLQRYPSDVYFGGWWQSGLHAVGGAFTTGETVRLVYTGGDSDTVLAEHTIS